MKHAISSTLVAALLLTALPVKAQNVGTEATDTTETVVPSEPYPYASKFPPLFRDVGFGMTKEDFLLNLTEKQIPYQSNSSQNLFLAEPAGQAYTGVLFFFNSNAGPFLTEIEVRFADEVAAKAYFDEHFPERAADGDSDIFNPAYAFRTTAWQFKEKVYFVAVLANTRWSNQYGGAFSIGISAPP